MSISRRLFLRSVPPAMAVSAVVATPFVAEAVEQKESPVERVNRLAEELSHAMDDWMADLSTRASKPALWQAHVFPASHHNLPVMFENMNARRPKTPHEQAIWHMRELERLALGDGAETAVIFACGLHYKGGETRSLQIHHTKQLIDRDGMFRHAGVVA
ncbi:hypothetical protein [Mesorhizobium sp. GR13]|nr:hypothetical protein [Mesorhizobium sp. GR13]